MSLGRKLIGVTGLVASLGAIGFAQQPSTSMPQGPDLRQERMQRMGKHRGRMQMDGPEGRRERFGIMHELNLSDEQRQKQRAIMQNHFAATKSQREELFRLREKRLAGTFTTEDAARAQALHQEIRNSMQGIHQEMDGILTPEQRMKLEELKQERKAKHQEMRQRRTELRNNNTPG